MNGSRAVPSFNSYVLVSNGIHTCSKKIDIYIKVELNFKLLCLQILKVFIPKIKAFSNGKLSRFLAHAHAHTHISVTSVSLKTRPHLSTCLENKFLKRSTSK